MPQDLWEEMTALINKDPEDTTEEEEDRLAELLAIHDQY